MPSYVPIDSANCVKQNGREESISEEVLASSILLILFFDDTIRTGYGSTHKIASAPGLRHDMCLPIQYFENRFDKTFTNHLEYVSLDIIRVVMEGKGISLPAF